MSRLHWIRQSLRLWVVLALGVWSAAAQAHGPYGPYGPYGYRGHWGYDPWFNSFVMGAAIGGTAVYLSRPYPPVPPPAVVISQTPVVVVNAPATPVYGSYTVVSPPVPVAEAYYCREAAQYYPTVQTCPSTWVLVRTR
jgi:hypothetical protein